MSKCVNCKIRKYYAKKFDFHWHGEDDCPYECNKETTEHGDFLHVQRKKEVKHKTEYISREEALNFELEVEADPEDIQAITKGMALYAEYIKSIPAADVVERR